jgi:hypothetical protein
MVYLAAVTPARATVLGSGLGTARRLSDEFFTGSQPGRLVRCLTVAKVDSMGSDLP